MCLEVLKQQNAKIADKDIIVYKHLRRVSDSYVTPYQREVVLFNGEILTTELRKLVYSENADFDDVDFGYHSFTSKKSCIVDARDEKTHYIVECIIPAGSEYFLGTFIGASAIASNKIIYKKILLSRDYTCDDFQRYKAK